MQGGTAVFAFRGTESVKDAKVDADTRVMTIPWMTRHFDAVRGHKGAPLPAHCRQYTICVKVRLPLAVLSSSCSVVVHLRIHPPLHLINACALVWLDC